MNQRVRSFYVRTDGVHILLSRRGGLLSEHEGWRPWPRRGRGCQGRSSLKHLPGKHPDTQDEDEGVVPRGGKRTQAAKGPCAGSWVLSRPHLPYLAAKNQRQQSSLVSPTEPPDCLSAGLWVVRSAGGSHTSQSSGSVTKMTRMHVDQGGDLTTRSKPNC